MTPEGAIILGAYVLGIATGLIVMGLWADRRGR